MRDRAQRRLQVVRRGIGEFLQIGIGPRQFGALLFLFPFDLVPRGDVDDAGQYHRLAIDIDRIESDLQWKFGAVACAARTGRGLRPSSAEPLCKETIPQGDMPMAEALRQQQFQRLAMQYRAVVAEHAFGLSVHHLDPSGTSRQHQGGRRRLYHPGKSIFRRQAWPRA